MKKFLNESSITLLISIGLTLAVITSFNTWHWFSKQSFYQGILPEKLEISGAILFAENNIFASCFFAVYKLSDKTIYRINQEGLAFFTDATKGRGYREEDSRKVYYTYNQWETSPFNDAIFRHGTFCARENGFDISLLERNNDGFYTWHYRGELRVIPKLGIAVISGANR